MPIFHAADPSSVLGTAYGHLNPPKRDPLSSETRIKPEHAEMAQAHKKDGFKLRWLNVHLSEGTAAALAPGLGEAVF